MNINFFQSNSYSSRVCKKCNKKIPLYLPLWQDLDAKQDVWHVDCYTDENNKWYKNYKNKNRLLSMLPKKEKITKLPVDIAPRQENHTSTKFWKCLCPDCQQILEENGKQKRWK